MKKAKPFVFISYTADAEDMANKLTRALSRHKIDYWIWNEQMKAGDATVKFMRAVEGATFFVPVISPRYKERPATNEEIESAFSREVQLRAVHGNDFSFVMPLLVSELSDMPSGFKQKFAVRSPDEIIKAIEFHKDKISLKDTPYSFSSWPRYLVDDNGEVDALVIIGHSGKESKPSQSEIDSIMPALDMSIECRKQSQRIAEYLPILTKCLDSAGDKVRKSKGLSATTKLSDLFQCHVDWHAIKFHQDSLRKQNIIALGAGDTNLVSRWILSLYHDHLPIKFDSPLGSQVLYCDATGTLHPTEIDSVETDMHRYGSLLLIVPNPLNPEKIAVVAAGLTALGTQAAILALSENASELSGGAYKGNFARLLIGKEKNWRAVGYTFIR